MHREQSCVHTDGLGSNYINVKSFGAIGDCINDDTAAIQKALNTLSGTGSGSNARSGEIYFPTGCYKITSPLNFVSGVSQGVRFIGDSSSDGGSEIAWFGLSGETMIRTRGLNQSSVENLRFNGRFIANRIFSVESNQTLGGAGSSDLTFKRSTFANWSGVGSAGVTIGVVGTSFQVDTLDFYSCDFNNDETLSESGAGYLVLGNPGNQKNVSFWGGVMRGVDYGVDALINLGHINVDGVTFLNTKKAAVRMGGGFLSMTSCAVETSFNESKLLTGSGGFSNNPATAILTGNYITSTSALGTAVVVDHFGAITLQGNEFNMGPAVPAIQSAVSTPGVPAPGAIVSQGNFYFNASGKANFVDYGNNDINLMGQPISSQGDHGVVGGTMVQLAPIFGARMATTATITTVPAATVDTTLLNANTSRQGASIYNESTATLFLTMGTGASQSKYTVQVGPTGIYEVPFNYTGQINGIWTASVGQVRVTEYT